MVQWRQSPQQMHLVHKWYNFQQLFNLSAVEDCHKENSLELVL